MLLQDCDSKLSKWFASRPDARYVIRKEFIMATEITIMGYKFEELDIPAQQKARAWYCENAMHHEWWDEVYRQAKKDGEAKGFEIDDIQFSGFWSQGDGAHWTGRIDMPAFLEAHMEEDGAWYGEDVILLALWSEGGWIDRFVGVHNRSYRSSHSGGMSLSEHPNNALFLEDDDDAELRHGALQGANVYQLAQSFDYEQRIEEWCSEAIAQARAFADNIYKKLREEYEYYTSDECIADVCDVNDWLFNNKGELI